MRILKKRKQNQYDTTNWDNSDDGNGGITGKDSITEKDAYNSYCRVY